MSPTVLDVIIVADVEWSEITFTPCNVRTNLFVVWEAIGDRLDGG